MIRIGFGVKAQLGTEIVGFLYFIVQSLESKIWRYLNVPPSMWQIPSIH